MPCGHCLHTGCFRQWQAAPYNNRRTSLACRPQRSAKCPMCNSQADTFVPLFLDHHTSSSAETNKNVLCDNMETPPQDDDELLNSSNNKDFIMEELLANQERVKTKLKRCKRQNKSLKHELQTERKEVEEMLVSTIQNFYKIMDKHEAERKRWSQGALDLRRQLDDTLEDQIKERREWTLRQKLLQQQLVTLQNDCVRANQRVQSATEGLAELKMQHAKRQSKLQVVLQEKTKLVQDNRLLKKAVLTTHGPIRSEKLW